MPYKIIRITDALGRVFIGVKDGKKEITRIPNARIGQEVPNVDRKEGEPAKIKIGFKKWRELVESGRYTVHNSGHLGAFRYRVEARVRLYHKEGPKAGTYEWFTYYKTIDFDVEYKEADKPKLEQQFLVIMNDELINSAENYDFEYDKTEVKNVQQLEAGETQDVPVKAKGVPHHYAFLKKADQEINDKLAMCLPEYLIYRFQKSTDNNARYKSITIEQIKAQLRSVGIEYEKGISSFDFVEFLKRFYPRVAVHVFDGFLKRIIKHVPEDQNLVMAVIINNKHAYPIDDEEMLRSVVKTGEIRLDRMTHNKLSTTSIFIPNRDKQKIVDGLYAKEKYSLIATDTDLAELSNDIIKRHGVAPTGINIGIRGVDSFIHPITGQIIEFTTDYEARKSVSDEAYKLYRCEAFKFKNESYTSIARHLFELVGGRLAYETTDAKGEKVYRNIQNFSTNRDRDSMNKWHTHPVYATLTSDFGPARNRVAIDHTKSHSTIIEEMTDAYPCYSCMDSEEDYHGGDIACGEYLIQGKCIDDLGGFILPTQFYSYVVVRRWLARKLITKKEIIKERRASFSIPVESLRIFKRYVYKHFDEDTAKRLVNLLIGYLGKRYTHEDRGFITTSVEHVIAVINQYDGKDGYDVTYHQQGDLYFVRLRSRQPQSRDVATIYRQVISVGIDNLMTLIEKMYIKGKSQLIGYKTDCVYMANADESCLKKEPKRYHKLDYWTLFREHHPIVEEAPGSDPLPDWIRHPDWHTKEDEGGSMHVTGGPGTGKTTTCRKKQKLVEKCLGLSLSNNAVDNMKSDPDAHAMTFDSRLGRDSRLSPETTHLVQVDEMTMTPWYWYEALIEYKQRGGNIQTYGDGDQCGQPSLRHFEYMNKRNFRYLVDFKLCELPYIEGTSRFDQALREYLKEFLEAGILPSLDQPINKELKKNITRTRAKCKQLIAKLAGEFKVGDEVIGEINDKKKSLFRSRIYTIEDVKENKLKLSGIDELIDKSAVSSAVAITSHRSQGSTIRQPYNIYELERMNLNELYTALSRATKLSDVHFTLTGKKFHRIQEKSTPTKLLWQPCSFTVNYLMTNHEAKNLYVGITDRTMEERMNEHLTDPNDPISKIKGKWEIKKLSVVHCFCERDRRVYEEAYTKYYRLNAPEGYEVIDRQYKLPNNRRPVNVYHRCPVNVYHEPSAKGPIMPMRQKYSIERRDGKKATTYRIRYKENGKQISLPFKSLAEAEAKRDELFRALAEKKEVAKVLPKKVV